MNKTAKWIVGGVAALVLLLAGVIALVSSLVDEAQLKTSLLDAANARVNGSVAIDSELEVAFWPRIALELGGLRVAGTDASAPAILVADRIRLGLAIAPLFAGRLRASEVTLVGLQVHIERNADGRANWEELLRVGETASQPPAGGTTSPSAPAPGLLAIDELRIEAGSVRYLDSRSDRELQLRDITLASKGINFTGDPFQLAGSATLQPAAKGPAYALTLETGASSASDPQRLLLTELRLQLAPAQGEPLSLRAERASIVPTARTAELEGARLEYAGLGATLATRIDWSGERGVDARGTVEIAEANLVELLPKLGHALPPDLNPESVRALALRGAWHYAPDAFTIEEMHLQSGGFSAEGSFTAALPGGRPFRATLQSPELDLDYFLPPPPATAKGNGEDGKPVSTADIGPLLVFEGRIDAKLGKFHAGKFALGALEAALLLRPGEAEVESFRANYHDGRLQGSALLDARRQPEDVRIDARFDDLDLHALLASQQIENIEGRLSGTAALRARGNAAPAWTASLAGPVDVHITAPVVHEVSVNKLVCEAAAKLNREKPTARFDPLTRMESIDVRLDFEEGVGALRRMDAALPHFAVRGDGKLDLPARKLRIDLRAQATDDLSAIDNACRLTRKMQAVEWPVQCKGSFDDDPTRWCGVDAGEMTKIALKLTTQSVPDKIKGTFDKLFGRGD